MTMTELGGSRTIRPLRHLHWRRTALGNIALVAPGAAIGMALALMHGTILPAAALVVVLLVTVAIVVVPALRIRIVLDREGAHTFWISPRGATDVTRSMVHRAVVRAVYNSDGVSTNQHLFLLGHDGRPALRVGDRWWSAEQLLAVAQHFDVALEVEAHPVSLAELRRSHREELTWSERHRFTAGAIAITGGFALCVLFAVIVNAA